MDERKNSVACYSPGFSIRDGCLFELATNFSTKFEKFYSREGIFLLSNFPLARDAFPMTSLIKVFSLFIPWS